MRTGKLSDRRRANQSGSAFIEFALVSLIMLPIFFAVIDYSRVFYYGAIVQGAARAGTQYALNSAPNEAAVASIEAAATADASNVPSSMSFATTPAPTFFCACSNSTAQVSCTSTCGTGYTLGTYSQVNTQLTFTTYFKYPLLPTSITVTGQSIVQVH